MLHLHVLTSSNTNVLSCVR